MGFKVKIPIGIISSSLKVYVGYDPGLKGLRIKCGLPLLFATFKATFDTQNF